jgi:hypothetical protein
MSKLVCVWVTKKTKTKALRVRGRLEALTGRKVTYDDLFDIALDLLDENQASAEIKRRGESDPLPLTNLQPVGGN